MPLERKAAEQAPSAMDIEPLSAMVRAENFRDNLLALLATDVEATEFRVTRGAVERTVALLDELITPFAVPFSIAEIADNA